MRSYTIGLYEKAMPGSFGWREKLQCAGELGYDFVEISIDESEERLKRLEWSAAQRTKLVLTMQEINVPIRSMCLSAHRKYPFGAIDPQVRKHSMEIMQKAVNLADDLGIRIIQLAGYDIYYEAGSDRTRRYFKENLMRAVEMAAERGILLGFETMETDFMNTVGKAMEYVSLIRSPYLGIYPDCGNLTNAALENSLTVTEDLALGKGHLVALHLKETVPGKYREVPFLAGHVNFENVIRAAWNLGVRRYVTEMWDVGKPDWKTDVKLAIENMSRILDRQNTKE